ncbi:MAG: hypothetical protein AAGI66_00250 [Cyanobacteria bacterium P01_H01_bin.74]
MVSFFPGNNSYNTDSTLRFGGDKPPKDSEDTDWEVYDRSKDVAYAKYLEQGANYNGPRVEKLNNPEILERLTQADQEAKLREERQAAVRRNNPNVNFDADGPERDGYVGYPKLYNPERVQYLFSPEANNKADDFYNKRKEEREMEQSKTGDLTDRFERLKNITVGEEQNILDATERNPATTKW